MPHAFEWMLAVLRFMLTKGLDFVVCPFLFLSTLTNSTVLGEHFHTHWDVTPTRFPNPDLNSPSTIPKSHPSFVSETASVRSAISYHGIFVRVMGGYGGGVSY